jgi:hypothetical protein
MSLEDNRREYLYPVGDQLPMVGLAQLAGLGIKAKAPGPIPGHERRAHVGGASADRLESLSDPAGDKLVVAWRHRALSPLNPSLALFARVMPGLLPRQELGEHMGLATPTRRALIALAPVTGLAIGPIQLDPGTRMLRPRTPHPCSTDSRHAPRVPPQPDGLAQREARGGAGLGTSGAPSIWAIPQAGRGAGASRTARSLCRRSSRASTASRTGEAIVGEMRGLRP